LKLADIKRFQETVMVYYQEYGRHDLPWRIPEPDGHFDTYKILVSELMLQQTQVLRVIPKYHEFLKTFPSIESLANASLGEVLVMWSGLGYNRRAKFLWQTAQAIVSEHGGHLPSEITKLVTLPGVGKNTAAAITAYAFNLPAVFIETNIRTVYIHHFFQDKTDIPDTEILQLVSQTLDMQNPRIWFWSLMDYGTYLKQANGNLNKLSKSYVKQSSFIGSRRQIRGKVIRLLSQQSLSESKLINEIADERLQSVLDDLLKEQMIVQVGGMYRLR